MVKISFAPNTENLSNEDDTKPLNPNELLLMMFNQETVPQDESNEANPNGSINSDELTQSLLKNLLNQPPVNTHWKPKLEETQNALRSKFPSHAKQQPQSGVIRPPKPPLLKLPQKVQSPLQKPLPRVHPSGLPILRPVGSMGQSRNFPSPAAFLNQLPKTEASLTQLNPTLASALSALPSSSSVDTALSRRLSGPVKVESPVVPFNVQRSQLHQPNDLPSSHIVSYNGSRTEVPNEIRCHLCDHPMKMCYRKSKYKSEIREYPAYRCLRKGCQTFRAIRKVLEPETEQELGPHMLMKREVSSGDEALRSILSQPVTSNGSPPAKKIKGEEMGTLIYVPAVLTPNQVLRLQQAAFDILSPDSDFYIAPLIAPSTMSSNDVKNKLCTAEGRSEIKNQILGTKQLTPQELLAAMAASHSPDPPVDMPTLEAADSGTSD